MHFKDNEELKNCLTAEWDIWRSKRIFQRKTLQFQLKKYEFSYNYNDMKWHGKTDISCKRCKNTWVNITFMRNRYAQRTKMYKKRRRKNNTASVLIIMNYCRYTVPAALTPKWHSCVHHKIGQRYRICVITFDNNIFDF